MRARYYEPTSGRFINEDPDLQGLNWMVYCRNNPVSNSDGNGEWTRPDIYDLLMACGFALALAAAYSYGGYDSGYIGSITTGSKLAISAGCGGLAVAAFGMASLEASGLNLNTDWATKVGIAVGAVASLITLMTAAAKDGAKTSAGTAVIAVYVYGLALEGELIADEVDPAINGS